MPRKPAPATTSGRPFDLSEIIGSMAPYMQPQSSTFGRADPDLVYAKPETPPAEQEQQQQEQQQQPKKQEKQEKQEKQQRQQQSQQQQPRKDAPKKKAPATSDTIFNLPELVGVISPFMKTQRAEPEESIIPVIRPEDRIDHSKPTSAPTPKPPVKKQPVRKFVKRASKVGPVFELAELTGLIAQYLSPLHLARCVVVSQELYHLFLPYLWRHVHVECSFIFLTGSRDRAAAVALNMPMKPQHLAKFSHYMRTFEVDGPGDAFLGALMKRRPSAQLAGPIRGVKPPMWTTKCTNLRKLVFLDPCENMSIAWLATLLRTNMHLTHLQFSGNLLDLSVTAVTPLLDAIRQLPNLQHITLGYSLLIHEDASFTFLKTCIESPSLVEIICEYTTVGWRDHYCYCDNCMVLVKNLAKLIQSIIQAAKTAAGKADRPKIKSLKLPHIPVGYPEEVLLPLLSSGIFDLEYLDVPRISGGYFDELEECIRTQFPRLQRIGVSQLSSDVFEEQFESCSAMRADWDDDAEHTEAALAVVRGCKKQGIRSFQGRVMESFHTAWVVDQIIGELVEEHSATLEDVEVWDIVSTLDQRDLFSSCKNLKRFWMRPPTYRYGAMEEVFEVEDLLDLDWACTGMKEFSLVLSRPYSAGHEDDEDKEDDDESQWSDCSSSKGSDDDDDDDKSMDEAESEGEGEANDDPYWDEELDMGKMYAKVGSLTELEVLAVESDRPRDMTLDKGYLLELGGLKKLRRFEIRDVMATCCLIRQPEVEFIHYSWPALEVVAFETESKNLFRALVEAPHWKWLQQKRPLLRFELTTYRLPQPEN
ncbi:hypothetical protein BGZ70_008633 [Mortierella alpina]|uniref:F-box domain-containing protein n=1 Tax=Mortierella alpina TaxID=64518 RepID=A0A9P6M0M5_MORAP|nr:hypothetical protein BGZ70_008633 [Mortierella alpina]